MPRKWALLRIRQILFHVPPFKYFDVKEAESANVLHDGVDGKLAAFEQVRVVAPKVIWAQFIERQVDVLAEVLYGFQVRVNRRRSIVAADEFLPHSLHECCHRDLLSLSQHYPSNNHQCPIRPPRQRLRSSRLGTADSARWHLDVPTRGPRMWPGRWTLTRCRLPRLALRCQKTVSDNSK